VRLCSRAEGQQPQLPRHRFCGGPAKIRNHFLGFVPNDSDVRVQARHNMLFSLLRRLGFNLADPSGRPFPAALL